MEWKLYIEVLVAILLILTASYIILSKESWSPTHHVDEPPLVPQRVPYIGHVASLFIQGMNYFDSIRYAQVSTSERFADNREFSARCKAPIYTLNVLSKKLYVVTSPELVAAVSRNSKSLSFNPFISEIGARLLRPDEKTKAIINDNINGELGQWGYTMEVHDLTVAALGPGKDLDLMTRAMLIQSAAHLNSCDAEFAQGPIKLYAWTRHLFTLCSSKALYGSCNPFDSQPELEQAFW